MSELQHQEQSPVLGQVTETAPTATSSQMDEVITVPQQPFVQNNKLMLLAQHSTLSDLHQLRILSPDADVELRLKFYGNATDDNAWYEMFIVLGANAELSIANAVMASMAANAGSYIDTDDVSVDMVTATFCRLLRYFKNNMGLYSLDGELEAFAETYTLLHFIRNNCVPQVREILEAVKYAEQKPLWFDLFGIKLPNDLTPFALLNEFFEKHEKTIQIRLPRDNFAVRLFHFALINEAYGVVGAMLSTSYMLDALPLSIGQQLTTHLTTRVDFTLAFQDKEPREITTYVAPEQADEFKKKLSNYTVETLWPALSFLSQWNTAGKQTKKNVVLRKNLDTIESSTERAVAAARIVDDDVSRSLEYLKLITSRMAKDLSDAVHFRERCRDNLCTAKQRLEEFCESLTQRAERGDAQSEAIAREACAHLATLQECLDLDSAWVEEEYSKTPPQLPNDDVGREGILVVGESEHISALHGYITLMRSRLAYYTRDLERAFEKQQQIEALSHEAKLEMLRVELEQDNAAAYFGEDE